MGTTRDEMKFTNQVSFTDQVSFTGSEKGIEKTVVFPVEDLAAGADIDGRYVFSAPAACVLTSARIIPSGTAAGIDAANTCVVTLKDGAGNVIVTKTYDNVTLFPAQGTTDDLGTLSATHKVLTQDEGVELEVTNGLSADPPAFTLLLSFVYS